MGTIIDFRKTVEILAVIQANSLDSRAQIAEHNNIIAGFTRFEVCATKYTLKEEQNSTSFVSSFLLIFNKIFLVKKIIIKCKIIRGKILCAIFYR